MANTAKYQSQPQQQQLTGDLTRKEIVEVLQELHFGGDDVLRAIAVDRNVRDCWCRHCGGGDLAFRNDRPVVRRARHRGSGSRELERQRVYSSAAFPPLWTTLLRRCHRPGVLNGRWARPRLTG